MADEPLTASGARPQAMVLMMPPSGLVGLFEELELEAPLRSAMELSMKDEIIDCADAVLVEVAPEAVPAPLEPPVRALIRL